LYVLYWCEGDDADTYNEEDVKDIYGRTSQRALMFIILTDDIPIGECWLQEYLKRMDVTEHYPDKD